MAKKAKPATTKSAHQNLPTVSKQTAGGIGGAVVGGILAGPVGAVAGGVAGALLGNSSAAGNKPVKKAAASVRSALSSVKSKGLTGAKKSTPAKKAAAKKTATKKRAVKSTKTAKASSARK